MNYKLFAALTEDINQGWVWVYDPNLNDHSELRPIGRITNPELPGSRSVYCEILILDSNCVDDYNQRKHTYKILPGEPVVVMNGWYRKKLGNLKTYAKTHDETNLMIDMPWDNRRLTGCNRSVGIAQIAS